MSVLFRFFYAVSDNVLFICHLEWYIVIPIIFWTLSMPKKIILASQSPRRQQLLEQLGLTFDVVLPNVDESPKQDELIPDYAKRLSLEKAIAGFQQCVAGAVNDIVVIGSDTCGEINEILLGKPTDFNDAKRLLKQLSGNCHAIHTGFSLYDGKRTHTQVVTSWVTMRTITDAEIHDYWQTGEPCDKAGAYAIQGLGAKFVSHLSGSYSAVMGLPLYELSMALQAYR